MLLESLGWDESFAEKYQDLEPENKLPGRVVWQSSFNYRVQCEDREISAELTGKMKTAAMPAVGDWVAVHPAPDQSKGTIFAVLPRRSVFSRNAAGRAAEEQVAAANIDYVFIVVGVDRDYNLRRIERYITLVYNSGASPVVVLNKADLVPDIEGVVTETESVCPGVPVYPVSAKTGKGMEQFIPHIEPGKTVAFLGSSGAGKSTLINRLLGEERMRVADLRQRGGKGRHTTTHRELFLLPGGGAVIDTPGMREIQVWGTGEGLSGTFPEIEELAAVCRYRDCRHETENSCAVREAVKSGHLEAKRFENYLKLRAEFENLENRLSQHARREERLEGKRFAKMVREVNRFNPKRKT
jgi:ribosome biogenesis GTPase